MDATYGPQFEAFLTTQGVDPETFDGLHPQQQAELFNGYNQTFPPGAPTLDIPGANIGPLRTALSSPPSPQNLPSVEEQGYVQAADQLAKDRAMRRETMLKSLESTFQNDRNPAGVAGRSWGSWKRATGKRWSELTPEEKSRFVGPGRRAGLVASALLDAFASYSNPEQPSRNTANALEKDQERFQQWRQRHHEEAKQLAAAGYNSADEVDNAVLGAKKIAFDVAKEHTDRRQALQLQFIANGADPLALADMAEAQGHSFSNPKEAQSTADQLVPKDIPNRDVVVQAYGSRLLQGRIAKQDETRKRAGYWIDKINNRIDSAPMIMVKETDPVTREVKEVLRPTPNPLEEDSGVERADGRPGTLSFRAALQEAGDTKSVDVIGSKLDVMATELAQKSRGTQTQNERTFMSMTNRYDSLKTAAAKMGVPVQDLEAETGKELSDKGVEEGTDAYEKALMQSTTKKIYAAMPNRALANKMIESEDFSDAYDKLSKISQNVEAVLPQLAQKGVTSPEAVDLELTKMLTAMRLDRGSITSLKNTDEWKSIKAAAQTFFAPEAGPAEPAGQAAPAQNPAELENVFSQIDPLLMSVPPNAKEGFVPALWDKQRRAQLTDILINTGSGLTKEQLDAMPDRDFFTAARKVSQALHQTHDNLSEDQQIQQWKQRYAPGQ